MNDDLYVLAGEYVLGILSASTSAEVERRLLNEPALRLAVQQWEADLLPLASIVPPVSPSPQLWTRIARSATAPVVTAPRRRWWDSLGLWRTLTAGSMLACAVLAVNLASRAVLPPAPQYMVVLVAPQDKAPGYVVQADAKHQVQLTPLATAAIPGDKSLQFWTKAEGWKGPVSLGLVKPGQTITIPLDALPNVQPNQLFELTLEPVNGSPLNKPTGPVQFIGRAVKVM
ncbi:MAG: anti-sigma factor domain-containing protein [Massilia sp.]